MTRKEALDRIEILRDCIAWSLQNHRVLSDTQRICLNQERAGLLSILAARRDYVKYEIPDHLESKVRQIQLIIKQTRWSRINYERQFTTQY